MNKDLSSTDNENLPYPHNILVKLFEHLSEHTEYFVLGFKLNGESNIFTVTNDHYASLGMIPTMLKDVKGDLEVLKVEENMMKEIESIRKFLEDS